VDVRVTDIFVISYYKLTSDSLRVHVEGMQECSLAKSVPSKMSYQSFVENVLHQQCHVEKYKVQLRNSE